MRIRQTCKVFLERNVFVGDFGPVASGFITRWRAFHIRIRGTAASAKSATVRRSPRTRSGSSAVGAATQHAKIAGYDVVARALLAFLILPFARLNAAFDVNQRTLLQILLGNFRLFAPHRDLVPFGALLTLTVLVLVRFVRRERKIGDGLPASGKAGFRIAPEAPHENHFVD